MILDYWIETFQTGDNDCNMIGPLFTLLISLDVLIRLMIYNCYNYLTALG
jgi:hypothetical protein